MTYRLRDHHHDGNGATPTAPHAGVTWIPLAKDGADRPRGGGPRASDGRRCLVRGDLRFPVDTPEGPMEAFMHIHLPAEGMHVRQQIVVR